MGDTDSRNAEHRWARHAVADRRGEMAPPPRTLDTPLILEAP